MFDIFQGPDSSLPQHGGGPSRSPSTSGSAAASRQRRACLSTLTDGDTPPAELLEVKTPQEQELIRKNWVSVQNYSHGCRVQSVYNVRLAGEERQEIVQRQLDNIFSAQSRAFKVNTSLGLTLRHNKTGKLRYFHASSNNAKMMKKEITLVSMLV